MPVARTIAKNTLVLLIAQCASSFLGFFYVIYAARYLGVEGYGIISFGLAFLGVLGAVADFGYSSIIAREVARDRSLAGKYIGNLILARLVLIGAMFAGVFLFAYVSHYPIVTTTVLYLLTLSTCFSLFTINSYAIFQAFEKMEFQSIGIALTSVFNLLGALVVIHLDRGLIAWAAIFVVSNAVVFAYSSVVLIGKFTRPKVEFDPLFLRHATSLALPFAISSILSITAFRIDMVLLAILVGDIAVGIYSAAYGLLAFLIVIPSIIATSIYPRLSILFVTSQKQLTYGFNISLKLLFVVSLPIAVGTTLLAQNIIFAIYNTQFDQSIIALRVLIWTVPFIFATYFFGTTLASINRQDLAVKILGCCALFNIALNLVLIPRFSYVGAAVVTVATEVLGFALQFYALSKLLAPEPLHHYAIKPILASAIMGAFIIVFAKIPVPLIITLSILVYFFTIILLRYFSKEEFALFKRIIRPSAP
jgi:O-antigen/teichoic acid export membrane protein